MAGVQHWAVTNRESGEVNFVERPIGEHPSDAGYGPKGDWHYVKIDRSPEEDDRFDGKRLIKCPKRARALRHAPREKHHQPSRVQIEDLLRAILTEFAASRGLLPITAAEQAAWFPNLQPKE